MGHLQSLVQFPPCEIRQSPAGEIRPYAPIKVEDNLAFISVLHPDLQYCFPNVCESDGSVTTIGKVEGTSDKWCRHYGSYVYYEEYIIIGGRCLR